MGQRHQLFLHTINPVHEILKYNKHTQKEIAYLKRFFGTNETTILAFHNQWLFGRTALQIALNALEHSSQFTVEKKTNENRGAYNTPFSKAAISFSFNTKDKFINAIEFILSWLPKKTSFNDAGFIHTFCINDDWGITDDFTAGDNNDGITIIDTINNKYCFMNIYEKDDNIRNDVFDLPELVPVSAHDYVSAYYNEVPENLSDYWEKEAIARNKTLEEWCLSNKKENDKLVKKFKKFELLTIDEIAIMFPKMKIIKKGNKNLVVS